MIKERVRRRLAAILAIDVVGYSRLMEEDEAGTLARLKAYRENLIEPEIAAHQGRIVKLMGDGILVEFASVVDAVAGAVAIQRGMAQQNEGEPEDRSIAIRIGINLGDVIIDGDDIYGNGVNVAARLESLAEPGGICISGRVLDQVEKNVNVGFAFLGPQTVKNIEKPVNAYKVLLDPADAGTIVGAPKGKATRRPWLVAAVVVLVAVAGGFGLWDYQIRPEFEPASADRMAYPLPDDPSIAVLSFDNFSDDPQLDIFASGLTENLTSSLSKAPGLFVIARNSATTYKGKSINVKQVAEELGVRYVLEGSVQKAGEKLRITVELIDALSGRNIWSDRFDRQASDFFDLQDEITGRVFAELRVKLTDGDRARVVRRGTNSLEAMLYFAEGYGEMLKWTREGHIRAQELFEAAANADPKFARALGGIATIHWYAAKRGWSLSPEDSIRLGMEFAERAIEVDPEEPLGYQLLGNLYFLVNQPERAIQLRRNAIDLAPNDFTTVAGLAMRLKEFGREQEAVELFEHAMRLSPKHPWWVPFGYGLALHLVGRKEEAENTYKTVIDLNPNNANTYARLAALYVDLGRIGDAESAAQEVLRLNPKFHVGSYLKSYPLHDPERLDWYEDLLLKASLPA